MGATELTAEPWRRLGSDAPHSSSGVAGTSHGPEPSALGRNTSYRAPKSALAKAHTAYMAHGAESTSGAGPVDGWSG